MSVVSEPDRAWQLVLDRDESADGSFVYAVETTGIYCRPSCPSRRPKDRRNVRFFQTPFEATRAGFRPCKRCRPTESNRRLELATSVCEYLDSYMQVDNHSEPPTLDELGEKFGYSPAHLQRVFKRVVGVTPHDYADTRRFEFLKKMLGESDDVTSAIYDAGFSSSSRVYENAYERLGMTPWAYSQGATDEHVRYAVTPSPLGWMLVAMTDKGVCAVRFGDDLELLAMNLSSEFYRATIELSEELEEIAQQIIEYIEGSRPHVDLPLDVQATAFQRRVWDELQKIPRGETRSYGQIAEAIGDPKAARAVGKACSDNPVAVLIPCHRVVAKDGSIGGYRWGAERKEWLLEKEYQAVHAE